MHEMKTEGLVKAASYRDPLLKAYAEPHTFLYLYQSLIYPHFPDSGEATVLCSNCKECVATLPDWSVELYRQTCACNSGVQLFILAAEVVEKFLGLTYTITHKIFKSTTCKALAACDYISRYKYITHMAYNTRCTLV